MSTKHLDTRGLRCPGTMLKMSEMLVRKELVPGDVLEVVTDCPTLEDELRIWCKATGKVLIRLIDEGDLQRATLQI